MFLTPLCAQAVCAVHNKYKRCRVDLWVHVNPMVVIPQNNVIRPPVIVGVSNPVQGKKSRDPGNQPEKRCNAVRKKSSSKFFGGEVDQIFIIYILVKDARGRTHLILFL